MDRYGSTENEVLLAKLLKRLVGAWGFEPQTPTVSSALPNPYVKEVDRVAGSAILL
jgi:hypothetical protein